MGCVSSKLFKNDFKEEVTITHGLNHVVSLTSSTYGLLNLDIDPPPSSVVVDVSEAATTTNIKQSSPTRFDPEVINAWEMMEGLEEDAVLPVKKSSPKTRSVLKGFADFDARNPLKLLNQFGSPMKGKRSTGKENNNKGRGNGLRYSPQGLPKSNVGSESTCKKSLNMSPVVKGSPKRRSFGSDSSRRKSFSPLFDPEMVANYEKEMSEEGEQIKRIVLPSPKSRKVRYCNRDCESVLKLFQKKCPPGGENAIVIYTTTLRGIRKTFEDSNNVRSIVESHLVRVVERDISMDSGFKEEIRGLMGTKEVRLPLVFVKGRLIGGADEIVKLEEEGKLGVLFDGIPLEEVRVPLVFVNGRLIGGADEIVKLEEEGKLGVLFDGIPKALGGCQGCAGMRFVICVECNGSCKVLHEGQKKMVKCGECNENGLIHCPLCC